MSRLLSTPETFDMAVDVLVIGAGACGMVAALRLADAGVEAMVLERDLSASGSTAMSSGFIPAPGTAAQAALGIVDSAEQFADDLAAKSHGLGDARLATLAARTIGPTLDWLAMRHGLEWQVLDDFLYPGHSVHRMHAVPEKTGEGLINRLAVAVENAGVPVVTGAHVTGLCVEGARVTGAEVTRPDGQVEMIGCRALVLACNGFGGNRALVAQNIPLMADAPYFGHAGNQGDALVWGQALGAAAQHLSGCQGHGSVAHPHGILLTWALMAEGAIQVNAEGRRFSNEHRGYSEQAVDVLAQPGGIAWDIFDDRLHDLARGFPDFRAAEAAGALRSASTARDLGAAIGIDADGLDRTISDCQAYAEGKASDPFGRDFCGKPPLRPPYHAIRVTGALFHTQGGLVIDDNARVLRPDGTGLPNLFAGGGAASGVSGPEIEGYLSGNGLLTAIAFGALAGDGAADLVRNG
ncbi:FAD-dependent oxidoreductase [Allorhizobium sp. BGMRC 0089]|uniref:FAD-dependent oxidoreductase n=1 Tax=Allorhizobium sonneratiae TaxID=2934936 RepID=UPI00203412C1|nr:FAD-dependent oxidoreductase [Allorhizobium sonneratiae]MCM2292417.1 FAD-dependent oxidoreductase [Allorhizobium sonneratiae]